jgi:hypothetical protein
MCGIVGIVAAGEDTGTEGKLGELMVPDADRHDRARPRLGRPGGVRHAPGRGPRKLSLYSGLTEDGADFNWLGLTHALKATWASSASIDPQGQPRHADVRHRPDGGQALDARNTTRSCTSCPPGAASTSTRTSARPAEVAERYDFGALKGSHLVGHTRMATESAVTPDRAHPFTAGEDFCLVHNGSLSNPNGIRRMLEPRGIHFETDNDTEAACRFLEWRLREGDDLETALQKGFDELDGFYTFLMGTPTSWR